LFGKKQKEKKQKTKNKKQKNKIKGQQFLPVDISTA